MAQTEKIEWIAVDWGTSNLRVWALDKDNQVVAEAQSDKGMAGLDPEGFEPALMELVEPWLGVTSTQVIACGMVGAKQGWIEASYLSVPTRPAGDQLLQAPTVDPRLDVRILAGVSQLNPPDVMRGEETQIAGLLHSIPDFDGIVCLPGTHTKWVQITDGEIFHFATFMTGEMFALLSKNSVLRHSVGADGWDDAGFIAALDDAMTAPGSIAARLFSLRAAGLLKGTDPTELRSRLSGLLIGLELAGARPYWLGQKVAIIGSGEVVSIYGKALDHVGLDPQVYDGTKMVLLGLEAAHKGLQVS